MTDTTDTTENSTHITDNDADTTANESDLPVETLRRFLREQTPGKHLIQVALVGGRGCGYGSATCPYELQGVFVEPTENLVGLEDPPRSYNWVGEYDGLLIDYSTHEVGYALRLLLRGDGTVVERLLAPIQLISSSDLAELQAIATGAISHRFFNYYRAFGKGVIYPADEDRQPSLHHLLAAYRSALTGVNLLREGTIELRLIPLALKYGVPEITELVQLNRATPKILMEDRGRWAKLLVKAHSLLEEALDMSELPHEPENPTIAADFLLDLRRRFFEAVTVQQ